MSSADEILKASKDGDYDRVLDLLNADPTLATASSMTGSQPIHAAHFGGHERVTELLFDRGVGLDFFLAAELGMVARVADALDAHPELAHAFSAPGSMALHRACYWGQTAVTRLLLDRGADPNAVTRDSFLQTAPLGCAVATPDVPNPSDHEDVVPALVKMLIAGGANVNGRRKDGLTALHSAAYRGHLRVIELLIARGAHAAIRGAEGAHARQRRTWLPARDRLKRNNSSDALLLAEALRVFRHRGVVAERYVARARAADASVTRRQLLSQNQLQLVDFR